MRASIVAAAAVLATLACSSKSSHDVDAGAADAPVPAVDAASVPDAARPDAVVVPDAAQPDACAAAGCPIPATPCAPFASPTCATGSCGVTYAPPSQYGNCQQNVCDTSGVETSIVDTNNVFDDGPCDPFTCSPTGVLTPAPVTGAACTFGDLSAGVCETSPDPTNPILRCAACDPAGSSCGPETVCEAGRCVPTACENGTQDDGETDRDCGGASCLPCTTGKMCSTGRDCFSGLCSGTTCAAPSCADATQNGGETDVDCGGPCPACAPTETCRRPADCASGVCLPTTSGQPDRCAAPSCQDGVQNGDETGVDCGGSCPSCG